MAIKTRKNSVKFEKNKNPDQKSELCVLCSKISDDEYLGKLLSTPKMVAHENCLLFSPILKQVIDPDVETDGFIMGFKISDVEREVKRIGRLKCSVCRKKLAGIGCCNASCRKSFHLSCGLGGNAIGIFKDCFQFYCTDHADTQSLKKYISACDKVVPECTICLDSLNDDSNEAIDNITAWSQFLGKLKQRTLVHGKCCSRCWMHRSCIRQYGLSAGLHHVKCPHCGDKDKFIEAVQQCGIWLPDRDASWELEPGAFQELYDDVDEEVAQETSEVHETSTSEHHSQKILDDSNTENKCNDDTVCNQEQSTELVGPSTDVVDLCSGDDSVGLSTSVRISPPALRKRSRPSETPPKPAKRRRTSKGGKDVGILIQRKCIRCDKVIMSLSCNKTSVLSEKNHNKTLEQGTDAKLEYVCVSCHK